MTEARRKSLPILPLALVLSCALFSVLPAQQGSVDALTQGARTYQVGDYIGPSSCATSNCHGKPEPANESWVLQNEYTIWFEEDLHRRSQEILSNKDSVRMGRLLGLKKPPNEAPECLTCHSLDVPKPFQANELVPEDGISCESCHGPAGGWLEAHTKRGWTHEQSVQSGMFDLRNIGTRLGTCLGCHLGNREHEVDHRLLAAGHPDLIFELDNFTAIMPPHWDTAKPVRERQAGREITHGARAWAVGQVESLRYALVLLIRRTEKGTWPEFTELNCESCHHDLGPTRWRKSSYTFHEGLAPWSPARWTVARHVIEALAPGDLAKVKSGIQAVSVAVSKLKPREEVKAAANRAVEALEAAIPRIAQAGLSEKQLKDLLRTILNDRDVRGNTDRKTAQAALFSVYSLANQLDMTTEGSISDGFFAVIEEELDRYGELYAYKAYSLDKPFAKLLQEMGP